MPKKDSRRPRISVSRFGLVFFFLSSICLSQGFEATVTGVVTDASGAVLPGVTVSVTNLATNVTAAAVSDETGLYTILSLRPAVYEVRAELPGFKAYIQSNVTLAVAQVARIDIKMEIGEISEEVQVIGETPLLNTETAAKGSVVTHEELIDLPLEGRDFNELAFLTMGVVPKNQGGQGGFANINGARADSINFVVDGGNNNVIRGGAAIVRPSLDSIQEFKVQTSNYSAEMGRRSTGVINMVLRSGTNNLHGTLFHFHRNAALDARNFFDRDKSKLVRNNFGGNLGGPIVRDKMFFFFNYEGMRRRDGIPRLARVPSLLEREGDFSKSSVKIIDPLNGKTFKANKIPKNRFHPIATTLLDFFPLPNMKETFGGNNFFVNKVDADNFDDYVSKLDYHFENGSSLSARHVFNDRALSNPLAGSFLPGFGNIGGQRLQMINLNYTHLFRPTLVNQTLVAFARKKEDFVSINSKTDFAAKFGIPGVTNDPSLLGFPRIVVRNYEPLGDAGNVPLDWVENDYQVTNTTSLTTGGHNIKIGGEFIRTQFFQLFANNARGTLNFQGRWTSKSANPRQQEPFADFLLGLLNSTSRRIKQTTNYLFNTTYAAYIQDDWKISRKLTLNLGLRYDLFVPPADKYGNWSNFDPAVGRLVISGEEGYPESLIYMDRNNFAPRVGFAWRPSGRKTVLRGGYGIFFGLSILNPLRLQLGANPPFTIVQNFSRDARNPLTLTFSSPFPEKRARIAGINAPNGYELRPNTANLQQYNLTIEQQFASDTVLEIGYVGSKGTHLGRQFDLNQPLRRADLAPNFPRPFPDFAAIDYFAFEADSNYHALQAGLRKRGRGINYRINYVLSKSIDDASQVSGRSAGGFGGVQDSRNRHLERGLSDFDRRHALVGSIIWQLPFGKGDAWFDRFARDWQMNSIVRLYSGTPFTPQLASADLNLGEARRPDRVGSGELEKRLRGPEKWFKVEDFIPVPAGGFRLGDSGRNILFGPAQYRWSFSVMRFFDMPGEGHRLQFRWEVFNVPNLVNFNMPDERVDRPTAGGMTTALDARQMQVALKYMF